MNGNPQPRPGAGRQPRLSQRAVVLATYAALLGLSALGAAVASQFDAPYGARVALADAAWALGGGLLLSPLILYLAGERRPPRLLLGALAGLALLAADYPLHESVYAGYAPARPPAEFVAESPAVFILSAAMAAAMMVWLLVDLLARLLYTVLGR